ncbi:hypothetical protein [Actinoallomurus sp. CA-142502]|uniref:hypothetical protein n=1 Tax=Actinoallomurus sp. CA-142502 TaxID=3239885 RepID=UPI003D93954D
MHEAQCRLTVASEDSSRRGCDLGIRSADAAAISASHQFTFWDSLAGGIDAEGSDSGAAVLRREAWRFEASPDVILT